MTLVHLAQCAILLVILMALALLTIPIVIGEVQDHRKESWDRHVRTTPGMKDLQL